jgi:hypothetical protein
MKRLWDWNSRLQAYLDKVRHLPYEEGIHDCALFGAGVIQAETGEDVAAPYRGYKTIPEGVRRLKKMGFDNHVELAASLLPEIHPSEAAIGDLCAFEVDDPLGWALGVSGGERAHVLRPADKGMGTIDTFSAKRAFRIPS